ncbi:hypothetical protein ACR34G_01965 [Mycoplasma sp. 480]|uniref:hypothetical protein n=1 Tax=Mycoplasma sp. 480 TaxID=3440155 RepID=UPI003F50E2C5
MKKKIWAISPIILSSTSILIVSCNQTNESNTDTINKPINKEELKDYKISNIKENSINLTLKIENLDQNKNYNLSFKFKNGYLKQFPINSSKLQFSFIFNKLESNTEYQISEIFLNDLNILKNKTISFKTLHQTKPSDEIKIKEKPEFDFKNSIFSIVRRDYNFAEFSLIFDSKNLNSIKTDENFKVTLNNNQTYKASYEFLENNKIKIKVNANNLLENTNYWIKKITFNTDDKDNVIFTNNDNSNNFSFKTFFLIDQVNELTIAKKEIILENNTENTSNNFEITLNQVKDSFVNKNSRISFINKENNNKIYSSEISLNSSNNHYYFIINNIEAGTYEFNFFEVEVNNQWIKFNNNSNFSKEFVVKLKNNDTETSNNNPKEPEQGIDVEDVNKSIENYGNIFTLQNANLIQNTEINVHNSTNFSEISKDSLLNKNSYYTSYFSYLNNTVTKPIQKETSITTNEVSNIDISSIEVSSNLINLNIINNTSENISSAKVLVKSFDQYNQWSKYIDLNINGNKLSFNPNLLSNYQNEFIVTELIINNNKKSSFNLQSKYKFIKENTLFNDLTIENFDIYKNENSKEIYATSSFNWSQNQLAVLSDKIFVFYFEVEKKVYKEKKKKPTFPFDPEIVINEDENFDASNSVPSIKKIYIPFSELSKFSIAGFQEKIKYKLKYIDIVNNHSFINFLPRKDVSNKNISFSYNFNWNNSEKLKNQLFINNENLVENNSQINNGLKIAKHDLLLESQKNTDKKTNINFSVENFNTLLDYNFDFYNLEKRYPNRKIKNKNTDFKLQKNNINQKIHWFKTREYLKDSIFKINENKNNAYIIEDLNSIIIPNDFPAENVLFWFVFELDLNPREFKDSNEFNDIHSRVRVPVSLKNIKENKTLENVDFLFDYVSENPEFQQEIFSKIKSNIKFSLSLENNKLKLSLDTKNNQIKFNNILSVHNHSNNRSAFINRSEFFVNWIQNESEKDEKISFHQQQKIDNNSILSTSTGYKNTYDLKTEDKVINAESRKNILIDAPNANDRSRRLYSENTVKPIEEGRNRVFSLNSDADGTWNIFAKVNDNSNDYRFYAFVNFHVWNTNRKSGIGTLDKNLQGYERITVQHPQLIASTNIARPSTNPETNKYFPIYINKEHPELQPDGNIFDFEIPQDQQGITFDLFLDFSNSVANYYGDFKNNNGEVVHRNTYDNLDAIIAIVDFKPIFTTFENQDLDHYQYKNRSLNEKEKNAIRHFLNFKKLKPLEISDLSLYLSSFNNLNFYMATLPKVQTLGNSDSYPGLRYREYLIGNNPIKFSNSSQGGVNAIRPAIWGEVQDYDWYSGSSGSGVYDSDAKVVGLDAQGGNWSASNFLIFDTQKYSFLKNRELSYNPIAFDEIIKKMSYLYPDKFKDIFSK